uniref:(California timema) hypothetical protein n=1 Tax=Timema californicum TaxID=61474 RepID=A0A7R9P7B7_TIMCA|nr:unnamed protein product [Timema californicum]
MEQECSSKLSERLWTTCEIRACSTDWSLAGDAGLLDHLIKFSQSLSDQTHTTEAVVETLLDEIKSTVIRLNNVTNTFLSLTNTQFMENRVYDDDDNKKSPLEDGNSDKVQTKEEQGADVIARMKASVTLGMSVLDTMFDAVDVSDSDSEEESSTSLGHTVFQPRDPYMSRPLPCLIGSKEFIEDDRVGLGELLSEEETSEKHGIHSSSSEATSDIEQDFLDGNKQREVFVSSESENSEPKSEKHQDLRLDIEVTSRGLEDDIFGQDCSPEAELDLEFPHIAKEGASKNFAAELASKLGEMSSVKIQEKIANTIKKPSNRSIDDLFTVGMESEDEEDSLFGKTHGKFSSGNDLFDHLDGEIAGVIATKSRVLIPENKKNAILNNSASPTSVSSGSSSMKNIIPRYAGCLLTESEMDQATHIVHETNLVNKAVVKTKQEVSIGDATLL